MCSSAAALTGSGRQQAAANHVAAGATSAEDGGWLRGHSVSDGGLPPLKFSQQQIKARQRTSTAGANQCREPEVVRLRDIVTHHRQFTAELMGKRRGPRGGFGSQAQGLAAVGAFGPAHPAQHISARVGARLSINPAVKARLP